MALDAFIKIHRMDGKGSDGKFSGCIDIIYTDQTTSKNRLEHLYGCFYRSTNHYLKGDCLICK